MWWGPAYFRPGRGYPPYTPPRFPGKLNTITNGFSIQKQWKSMQAFLLVAGIRHKILLYLQNPETEHLLKHWRKKYYHERKDIIVSLNRYWWFLS